MRGNYESLATVSRLLCDPLAMSVASYRKTVAVQCDRGFTCAHVLLNLNNEFGKRDKIRGFLSIKLHFATSLKDSIIQGHECKILFIIWSYRVFWNENLSLGFPTKRDPNRSTQLPRLARILQFRLKQA